MATSDDQILPDASTPEASSSAPTHDVVVRRSPRFVRFMAVGVGIAIVLTLILTFLFPEQPNYSRAQVAGFVGIILVTVFIGLSAAVAILVDRASSKRARTVRMTTSERVEAQPEIEGHPETEGQPEIEGRPEIEER